MRPIAVGAVAFILPALMTYAEAQQPVVAPHISAPAPHFSPPAPHFSPPAPHFSPPGPYMAPHFAVPNAAPPASHLAVPYHATPEIIAPHISTPHHDPGMTPGAVGGTVGHDQVGGNHPPQTASPQMHNINRTPILRNPTFANLSSRNPTTRSLSQSTFHGSFAQSGLAGERKLHDHDRDHDHHHRRHFGVVLGFVGPLFWPYAFQDLSDYTFLPYAYDTFWPYAFDDVFAGIYGAHAPEYYSSEGAGRTAAPTGGNSQICSSQEQGLTDFPIERIAQQVDPGQHQQALLDDLKAATTQAVSILQAACPSELPSTPTGRIAAMRTRVAAMLQAVQVARPALDKFYQSLSDEQKERFNVIDQDEETTGQRQADIADLCQRTKRNAGPLFDRTERALHLSNDQDAALKDLKEASAKAADLLKASCGSEQPLTPTGRLVAMEERLNAIV
ncbi:MAG TPA: Spy/CpxP family protein refolding chaperone [Steroidobacteraceae bacterium]|nr:Spy/CpxP family protein refolding chaperone [Steroidobacteraceae bacterium]